MHLVLHGALALGGCFTTSRPPLPPGVPAGAARVVSDGAQIRVDGDPVAPIADLARNPTEPTALPVLRALEEAPGRPVLVELPADTPFWLVRQVLNAADEAGAGGVWLAARTGPEGAATEAFPVAPPPRFALGGACDAPVPVTGAEPLITLSVQTGADGAWVLATARLVPVTAQGPTDGLEADCLAVPACDVLYPEGPLRQACDAQQAPAPQRVALGGELGCLLPIARRPEEVAGWRPELARLIGVLGLGDRPLRVVMPEAMSRLDAVLAVLGGFADAGLPPPALGTVLLVEGNDGPPVCNAPVRDEQALALAGARWIGGMRAWARAPEATAPPGEAPPGGPDGSAGEGPDGG